MNIKKSISLNSSRNLSKSISQKFSMNKTTSKANSTSNDNLFNIGFNKTYKRINYTKNMLLILCIVALLSRIICNIVTDNATGLLWDRGLLWNRPGTILLFVYDMSMLLIFNCLIRFILPSLRRKFFPETYKKLSKLTTDKEQNKKDAITSNYGTSSNDDDDNDDDNNTIYNKSSQNKFRSVNRKNSIGSTSVSSSPSIYFNIRKSTSHNLLTSNNSNNSMNKKYSSSSVSIKSQKRYSSTSSLSLNEKHLNFNNLTNDLNKITENKSPKKNFIDEDDHKNSYDYKYKNNLMEVNDDNIYNNFVSKFDLNKSFDSQNNENKTNIKLNEQQQLTLL